MPRSALSWLPYAICRTPRTFALARRQLTCPYAAPQNSDGSTDVRRRWKAAVCDTLGCDSDDATQLGEMLAREP